ncbi:S8 family peptidase [Legionella sainthelensi]|uniref:S8 family peptidase n=1 Tax=Legionella sainthelensi TaxID=28087 RepID=UPI000E206A66|nr:S8 family serine peptidase [Legionella sainthelensi]
MSIRKLFLFNTFWAFLSIGSHLFAAENEECGVLLDQIILKFNTVSSVTSPDLGKPFWNEFSKENGLPVQSVKPMPSGAYLVTIDPKKIEQLSQIKNKSKEDYFNDAIAQLLNQTDVKYADRNATVCVIKSPVHTKAQLVLAPNQLISHSSQWNEFNGPGGVFLESSPGAFNGAWTTTLGYANPPIVLSNLESINYNPDLAPNVLTGWSFSDNSTDVSDPKDNHGTHVAGIIAAAGSSQINTGSDIAGMGPFLKILPIEPNYNYAAIETAIYWAMGRDIPGVPHNNYLAKVINASFYVKGSTQCPASLQETIDQFNKSNGVIIVAAGNNNKSIVDDMDAILSCKNIIIVAATQINGYRADYSNYGPLVTLAAPGGEIPGSDSCYPGGILSTVAANTGCQNSGFAFMDGTSFAAPHVSGIAGLIYALNPYINAQEVKSILLESVMPFGNTADPERSCKGVKSCGVGIVNANKAVQLVTSGRTIIAAPSPTDLRLHTSFDPFNRCPPNKYVIKAESIASPITSKWVINDTTLACQTLSMYENPTLQVNGQQLKVMYGKTVLTLQTPGLTCQVNNSHGFIC